MQKQRANNKNCIEINILRFKNYTLCIRYAQCNLKKIKTLHCLWKYFLFLIVRCSVYSYLFCIKYFISTLNLAFFPFVIWYIYLNYGDFVKKKEKKIVLLFLLLAFAVNINVKQTTSHTECVFTAYRKNCLSTSVIFFPSFTFSKFNGFINPCGIFRLGTAWKSSCKMINK